MEKNCKRCGKIFTPKHPSREYCGPTCKQYAYFERKGMNFGSTTNPVKDKEDVKGVEDTQATEENKSAVEINMTEKVNPVNEIGVKDETLSIVPVTQEKIPVVKEETKTQEKKFASDFPKEKPESSITMTMEQLEVLLKKVAKENQMEKVIVIEKQVPAPVPVKDIKDERINPMSTITPHANSELQKENGTEINIFSKERYPNWYYSQWENVKYVNERMKSHFKKITELTKRTVDISIVKYISKQMCDMVDTVYFRYLPADYPFTDFIKEVAERIEKYVQLLEEDETEKIKVGLPGETYIKMKAIIAQIGTTVPDVEHSKPSAENNNPRSYNRYERRAKMREWGLNSKEG